MFYDFSKASRKDLSYRLGRETHSEREADELALKLIYNAGYSITEAPRLLQSLRGKGTSRHFSSKQLDALIKIVKEDIRLRMGKYLEEGRMVNHIPRAIHPKIPQSIKSMARQELKKDGVSWNLGDYFMSRIFGDVKSLGN